MKGKSKMCGRWQGILQWIGDQIGRMSLSICLVAICGVSVAQEGKVQMSFGADGTFKIVQFTDVHYVPQNSASQEALATMRKVIEEERPDLIIYTGDILTGSPVAEGIKAVFGIAEEQGIPFAYTFGNHDDEHDMNREAIYFTLQQFKQNVTTRVRGISGMTNYIIELSKQGNSKPQALLYIFDSHAYSQVEGIKGYDWIKSDQVTWYQSESAKYREANGGTPLPALAYFHIPLPEYNYAAGDEKCRLIGTRLEVACAPVVNTGLFAAMRLCGDVMGTFVGHDHVNDYLVSYYGILLGYGRFTGGATTYNDIPGGPGARVVELQAGERHFKTWLRLADGSTLGHYDTRDRYHK